MEIMTMNKVYISRNIFSEGLDVLQRAGIGFSMNEADIPLSKQELINNARGCQGLICLLTDTVDNEVFASLPDLQIVSNVAAGYNNIDVVAAIKHGVIVTNTPGVLTETTADLAFALMICSARRIAEADKYTREGKYDGWKLKQPHLGTDIHGKTLGIVGMGSVGIALARRSKLGFNMDIIYCDERSCKEAEDKFGAKRVSFEELLRASDFTSIHVPLTDMTRHLFGAREFKQMKTGSYLINTARGPIVNEVDLVEALKKGPIAGAGLDVFEDEPHINPELLKLENVVLTPHIGSASYETRIRMAVMAVENMAAVLNGRPPLTRVN
jgi:glyoxylate reductase